LSKYFPKYAFIGEETVAEDDDKMPGLTDIPTWIVDPIDGTTNFLHTFPLTCVSIGLVVNKRSVLGVVYCSMAKELFLGIDGHGAYLNGKKLNVQENNIYVIVFF
jgi:fructose-1,6-bisphosphatase/inositol monophosphatase family enzyme